MASPYLPNPHLASPKDLRWPRPELLKIAARMRSCGVRSLHAICFVEFDKSRIWPEDIPSVIRCPCCAATMPPPRARLCPRCHCYAAAAAAARACDRAATAMPPPPPRAPVPALPLNYSAAAAAATRACARAATAMPPPPPPHAPVPALSLNYAAAARACAGSRSTAWSHRQATRRCSTSIGTFAAVRCWS